MQKCLEAGADTDKDGSCCLTPPIPKDGYIDRDEFRGLPAAFQYILLNNLNIYIHIFVGLLP